MKQARIDVLSFAGCPNREQALELVERVTTDLGVDAQIRVIDVPDADAAERERFLGSPTIRVNGRDIEPGADARHDYPHSCRLYRTEHGLTAKPDERWLRQALQADRSDVVDS